MARSTVNEQIDGRSFTFTQMSPKDAHVIIVRVGKVVGNTFGKIISALNLNDSDSKDKSLLDSKIDTKDLGSAISTFLDRVDEAESTDVIDKLLSCVIGGGSGERGTMQMIDFQGNLKQMYKVAYKSAEVNFSDFLGEFGGLVEKLKTTSDMILAKPTSGGPTGGSSSPGSRRSRK